MTKTCSHYTRETLGKRSWKCYNLFIFHISFQGFCCWLWVRIYFLDKVSQWFEGQQWLFYTFLSKQIHAQQREPLKQQKVTQMKTYSKNNHRLCSIKELFWFSKIHRKISCATVSISIMRPETLLKKTLAIHSFSVNFAKFLRTPFSQNNSGWLVLIFVCK